LSLARFLRRSEWDDERARELEAHLAIETDENIARGMNPRDARDAARRKLGNGTRVREDIYQMNTIGWLEAFWRDLKHGARLLRLNPGFALVAILSLALGIGANTAIFQLLDAVQFRSLPVKNPRELVEIRLPENVSRSGNFTGRRMTLTNPIWEQIRANQQAFSGVFAWNVKTFDLAGGGQSRPAEGLWVSGEFFDVLGIAPIAGRLLTPRDDVRGCASPGVVISYSFWQREYGGEGSAVGRTIHLDGHPFEILGVTPPRFFGVETGRTFDVAVPICAEPTLEPARNAIDMRHYWWLDVIGRLRPGWTLEQARAHLEAISPGIFQATLPSIYTAANRKTYLANRLTAFPAGTGVTNLRDTYQRPLWTLLAVAGLVLLIACANIANLMLARASVREREIAVRMAMGASRARVVRQLTAESLLIAAIGAALGALLARSLSRFLVAFISTDADRLFLDLAPGWRVLGFLCAIASATTVMFGVMPALRATSGDPATSMKTGSRGATDSRRQFGLRKILVAAQVAISLVLVVGALLFLRTLLNLTTLDPGFRPAGVLVGDFDFRNAPVEKVRVAAIDRALRERLTALPGVDATASAFLVPLSGDGWNDRVVLDGVVQQTETNENRVSPGFFRLLGTPILAGRDFDERDTISAPSVAIVNQSFAERILGSSNAVGRRYQIEVGPGEPNPVHTVVGIVADTKYNDLHEPIGPIAYYPLAQETQARRLTSMWILVRSGLPAAELTAQIVAVARGVNPSMLVKFETLDRSISDSLLKERLMAALSGFFGGLAALLAIVGLYGVMSYMVARRRNEIGIRMALGADRSDILRLILADAAILLAGGLAIGAALSVAAARTASALLFGVSPGDPGTIGAAALALAAIATLASWVPARRAAGLEPTLALREE
jgi:putative ABC transport system permease protein